MNEKAPGRAFSTPVRLAGRERLVATAAAAAVSATTTAATATAAAAAVTAATAATRPGFARFGLVDRQAPSVDFLIMQALDGRLGLGLATHLNEAEPLASARGAVLDHLSARRWRIFGRLRR